MNHNYTKSSGTVLSKNQPCRGRPICLPFPNIIPPNLCTNYDLNTDLGTDEVLNEDKGEHTGSPLPETMQKTFFRVGLCTFLIYLLQILSLNCFYTRPLTHKWHNGLNVCQINCIIGGTSSPCALLVFWFSKA